MKTMLLPQPLYLALASVLPDVAGLREIVIAPASLLRGFVSIGPQLV